jgi:hypothetical protein
MASGQMLPFNDPIAVDFRLLCLKRHIGHAKKMQKRALSEQIA